MQSTEHDRLEKKMAFTGEQNASCVLELAIRGTGAMEIQYEISNLIELRYSVIRKFIYGTKISTK